MFYVNICVCSWVKVKYEDIDEFVIVGYMVLKGFWIGFGLLFFVMLDNGGLCYVGWVGIGFDDESLCVLFKVL